jgi:ABC-2 type transport system ATP-binding protein
MVDIEQLDFAYGRSRLFAGLSLSLGPGNIYGLLGLNGAGKSTLLKLMTGLLFPGAGRISALGHEPAARRPAFLADVFVLPEELNLPAITGEEYVRSLAPFYPRFDAESFDRYRTQFDLPLGLKLTGHSYGQKKKFLLAFGLASGTRLLVLDEPTNGLDIPSKSLFRRLVAQAATEERIFVISTHQVRDVEALIDPLILLHDGRVLLQASMSEIAGRIRMSQGDAASPRDAAVVYEEPAVGGAWRVWAEPDDDGRIDLEVLFNAIVAEPATFTRLFDREEANR